MRYLCIRKAISEYGIIGATMSAEAMNPRLGKLPRVSWETIQEASIWSEYRDTRLELNRFMAAVVLNPCLLNIIEAATVHYATLLQPGNRQSDNVLSAAVKLRIYNDNPPRDYLVGAAQAYVILEAEYEKQGVGIPLVQGMDRVAFQGTREGVTEGELLDLYGYRDKLHAYLHMHSGCGDALLNELNPTSKMSVQYGFNPSLIERIGGLELVLLYTEHEQ